MYPERFAQLFFLRGIERVQDAGHASSSPRRNGRAGRSRDQARVRRGRGIGRA